jgi:hypothetical protein
LPKDNPDYNAENGQPSIIWKGEIIIGGEKMKTVLSPLGHENPLGKDGDISANIAGITSALEILEFIEVEQSGN